MRELFEVDAQRAARYRTKACGILLDYSKNRINDDVMKQLLALAEACQLGVQRDAMFAGESFNNTENRAVLHTALRYQGSGSIQVAGQDVLPDVRAVRERCYAFASRVRSGEWKGFEGQSITDVVNIGIGGSDLPGIAGALKSADKCGTIKAVGFDVVPQGIEGMKGGCVDALISQKPFGMTAQALKILADFHNKKSTLPANFSVDTGVEVVTPDKLDAFLTTSH